MSNITFIVDFCKCCMRPADQCGDFNELIQRGVPPGILTYEVPYSKEVTADVDRVVDRT